MKITSLDALPIGGFVGGKVPVYYGGAAYYATISDISGSVIGAVSPQQYGGDPTGAAASDSAVAAAFATGAPVLIDGWYRLTSTLTTPAYSCTYLKNYDCGFILDMATTYGIVFGAGSIVPTLRAKSVAYPASAIANNSNWSLGCRKIVPGTGSRFGDVWLSDLTTGIDCDTVSDVQIQSLYARNIRSKEGWGAAWHTHAASDCWVGYLDAANCDRGAEPEFGSVRCGVMRFKLQSIYPNGYSGQPGTYATYTFALSAHAHAGEGGCRDIYYGDGWASDCLGTIQIDQSTATTEADYPKGIRLGNITIDSPRGTLTPVILNGIDVQVESLRFTGTANTGIPALVKAGITSAAILGRNVDIGRMEVDDAAYSGRLIEVDVPDFSVSNLEIGAQSGTSTAAAIQIQARGDRAMINRGIFRGAKYHASLYDITGTPANVRRMHTAYTLDGTNPATASRSAAWIALAGKYEANNADF